MRYNEIDLVPKKYKCFEKIEIEKLREYIENRVPGISLDIVIELTDNAEKRSQIKTANNLFNIIPDRILNKLKKIKYNIDTNVEINSGIINSLKNLRLYMSSNTYNSIPVSYDCDKVCEKCSIYMHLYLSRLTDSEGFIIITSNDITNLSEYDVAFNYPFIIASILDEPNKKIEVSLLLIFNKKIRDSTNQSQDMFGYYYDNQVINSFIEDDIQDLLDIEIDKILSTDIK